MFHTKKNKLMAATALSFLAASPLAAEADPTGGRTPALGPPGEAADGAAAERRGAAKTESKTAKRRYRVLYRRAERATGRPPGRNIAEDGVRDGRRARAATRREIKRSVTELRATLGGGPKASGASAAAAGRSASSAAPASGSSSSGALDSIAACESGGNPGAVGGGGQYRGKYQFDRSTWSSVGGTGDPASASESEQDSRAAALVAQQGTAAWPNCGG
ncbi:MAG: transglycosylase family protein [Thermoleophilaceae bacterium]